MPLKTPICDFGQAANSFELKSTNNEIIKLNDVKGTNGTLVMFICNHCPYVKAVIEDIVEDCRISLPSLVSWLRFTSKIENFTTTDGVAIFTDHFKS